MTIKTFITDYLDGAFTDEGEKDPRSIDADGQFVDDKGVPYPYFPHNWNGVKVSGTTLFAITVDNDNLFSLDYNPDTPTPYNAIVNGFPATLLGYCRNANTRIMRYLFTLHHVYLDNVSTTMQVEMPVSKRMRKA